jgi:phosphoribosylglycinamide formyltransferase-1
LQQILPVFDNDTATSLHARIQVAEHTVYPEAIRLFAEGKLKVTGRMVKIL